MFKDKDVTQEDIYNECYPPTDSNKLIAEFMGMKLGDDKSVFYDDAENLHPPTLVDELQFHTSWDWLMPVVDKVEQVNEGVPQQLIHLSLFSTINEVYEAVVEFIKNQNK